MYIFSENFTTLKMFPTVDLWMREIQPSKRLHLLLLIVAVSKNFSALWGGGGDGGGATGKQSISLSVKDSCFEK